jgi:hypothetical protein
MNQYVQNEFQGTVKTQTPAHNKANRQEERHSTEGQNASLTIQ